MTSDNAIPPIMRARGALCDGRCTKAHTYQDGCALTPIMRVDVRCICPIDPATGMVGRAIEGCPAHQARYAAQQYADSLLPHREHEIDVMECTNTTCDPLDMEACRAYHRANPTHRVHDPSMVCEVCRLWERPRS